VDKHRRYSEKWEENYIFIIQNTILMCLISRETVIVFNKYNFMYKALKQNNGYF